jgi:hypothetical protein
MEFIWTIGLIAMIYFGYQAIKAKNIIDTLYKHLNKPLYEYYLETNSEQEKLKMSFFVLSVHFECLPTEVGNYYFSFLNDARFNKLELEKIQEIWAIKKYEEAKMLHIDNKLTPASIMENLTKQFINKN